MMQYLLSEAEYNALIECQKAYYQINDKLLRLSQEEYAKIMADVTYSEGYRP